jgi:hypothetical protein
MRILLVTLLLAACANNETDGPAVLAAETGSHAMAVRLAKAWCGAQWCDARQPAGELERCVATTVAVWCDDQCVSNYAGPDPRACEADMIKFAKECPCLHPEPGSLCGGNGGTEYQTVPATCNGMLSLGHFP